MPIRLSSEETQKRLLEHQFIFGRYKRLGLLLRDLKIARDAKIKQLEAKIKELHGEIKGINRKLSDHNDIVENVHDSYFNAQTLYDTVETGTMDDIAEKILGIRGRDNVDFDKLTSYLDTTATFIIPDSIIAEAELEELTEEFNKKYPMTKIYKNA